MVIAPKRCHGHSIGRRAMPFGRFADVPLEELPPIDAPTDVSGCVLWLDAGEITGLNDDDSIPLWEDQSGEGHDYTQDVAGFRPTYKINILNGKPAVRFDGNDYLVLTPHPPPLQTTIEWSIFLVLKANSIDDWAAPFGIGDSFGDGYEVWLDNTGVYKVKYRGVTTPNLVTTETYDTSFHILSFIRSSRSTPVIRRNGVALALPECTEDPNTPTQSTLVGQSLNGEIAEVIVYNLAIPNPERNLVRTYLNTKYDIY